ncbi:MAG: hypothetical protein GEV05_29695 [Betaproteobacteria bacterium]|nr:hypothetical protein [Betaproteobacteria bacterium]
MQEFAAARHQEFQRNVTAAIKLIVEQKHLYQSVTVAATDSYVSIKPDKTQVSEKIDSVTRAMNAGWATEAVRPGADPIHLNVPDVKVFCSLCKRIEAFNSAYVLDVFGRIGKLVFEPGPVEQAFLLAYQCQSCKRTPELFLIRRRGLRLTLEGRSPIENVDVPTFVPDAVRRLWSVQSWLISPVRRLQAYSCFAPSLNNGLESQAEARMNRRIRSWTITWLHCLKIFEDVSPR